jgi:hypothetical protein
MQSDAIHRAVGDLIKNGNTIGHSNPSFRTDNIYPIFKKYFNDDAQRVFSIKTQNLIHQRDRVLLTADLATLLKKLNLKSCKDFVDGQAFIKREIDKVCFCASRSDRATIYRAVERVIIAINDLARRGYLTASMVELSVMALAAAEKPEPEFIVLSYVAVTNAGEQYITQHMPKMFVSEGGMPERFEDQ